MTFLVDSRVSGSPLSVLFYYRRENSSVFAGGEVGQVVLQGWGGSIQSYLAIADVDLPVTDGDPASIVGDKCFVIRSYY